MTIICFTVPKYNLSSPEGEDISGSQDISHRDAGAVDGYPVLRLLEPGDQRSRNPVLIKPVLDGSPVKAAVDSDLHKKSSVLCRFAAVQIILYHRSASISIHF